MKDLEVIKKRIATLNNHLKTDQNLTNQHKGGDIEKIYGLFMTRSYITYMSMAIRRLTEKSVRVHSLQNLLLDIFYHSSSITREWFLKEWPDGEGEPAFEDLFGNDSKLKSESVYKDICELEEMTKNLNDRTNRFGAHYDKKPKLDREPIMNDIDDAIKKL